MVSKNITNKMSKKTIEKLADSKTYNDLEDALSDSGLSIKDILTEDNKRELNDDELSNVNGGLDIVALIQMLLKTGVDKLKDE